MEDNKILDLDGKGTYTVCPNIELKNVTIYDRNHRGAEFEEELKIFCKTCVKFHTVLIGSGA